MLFGKYKSRGELKCGGRPLYGMDIFSNHPDSLILIIAPTSKMV